MSALDFENESNLDNFINSSLSTIISDTSYIFIVKKIGAMPYISYVCVFVFRCFSITSKGRRAHVLNT